MIREHAGSENHLVVRISDFEILFHIVILREQNFDREQI
jgi:hypothetical protein